MKKNKYIRKKTDLTPMLTSISKTNWIVMFIKSIRNETTTVNWFQQIVNIFAIICTTHELSPIFICHRSAFIFGIPILLMQPNSINSPSLLAGCPRSQTELACVCVCFTNTVAIKVPTRAGCKPHCFCFLRFALAFVTRVCIVVVFCVVGPMLSAFHS